MFPACDVGFISFVCSQAKVPSFCLMMLLSGASFCRRLVECKVVYDRSTYMISPQKKKKKPDEAVRLKMVDHKKKMFMCKLDGDH